VRRHLLRVLERAAIGEIGGDLGRTESMAPDRRSDAGRLRAAADHEPGIGLRQRPVGQRLVVPRAGPEQEALAIIGGAGGIDIGTQRVGERVMTRHRMLLAAFLVQPDRPSRASRPEILDLHRQRRGDPAASCASDQSGL
jgi:hypothetical protein